MPNILFIIPIALIILIGILSGLIHIGDRLINSNSILRKVLGSILLFLAFGIIFQSFLIAPYPDPSTVHSIEGVVTREYNPDESYTVKSINKWVLVDDIGWIYFKKLDTLDGNQLRLFYRRPGWIRNDIFEQNMTIINNNKKMFESDGGGIQNALLVSSGAMNFVSDDEGDGISGEAIVYINGKQYSLY